MSTAVRILSRYIELEYIKLGCYKFYSKQANPKAKNKTKPQSAAFGWDAGNKFWHNNLNWFRESQLILEKLFQQNTFDAHNWEVDQENVLLTHWNTTKYNSNTTFS